jgi:2-haloacid dehalogenase
MLQLSFVGGLTGQYLDFTTAQRAALEMVALRAGRSVGAETVRRIVDRMSSLPPHPEVPAALARLRETPLKIAALTNSVQAVAEAQLGNAGLRDLFDAVVSADSVRALKPAAAPYRAAARQFDVDIRQLRLVAAHSWDVSGALAAGARAAFVARPGMVLSPVGAQPDIVGPDIAAVVEQIIDRDAAGSRAS